MMQQRRLYFPPKWGQNMRKGEESRYYLVSGHNVKTCYHRILKFYSQREEGLEIEKRSHCMS